jgi:uncharacterized membrane protein YvbJ
MPEAKVQTSMLVLCGQCGESNPKENRRCKRCDAHLYVVCKRCGSENARKRSKCKDCGKNLRPRESFWKAIPGRKKRILVQVLVGLIGAAIVFKTVIVLVEQLPLG